MAGPSQVPTRICVVPGWLTNRASLANVVLGEEVLCNYLAIDSFDEFSGPDQVAARKTSRFLQGVFFCARTRLSNFKQTGRWEHILRQHFSRSDISRANMIGSLFWQAASLVEQSL